MIHLNKSYQFFYFVPMGPLNVRYYRIAKRKNILLNSFWTPLLVLFDLFCLILVFYVLEYSPLYNIMAQYRTVRCWYEAMRMIFVFGKRYFRVSTSSVPYITFGTVRYLNETSIVGVLYQWSKFCWNFIWVSLYRNFSTVLTVQIVAFYKSNQRPFRGTNVRLSFSLSNKISYVSSSYLSCYVRTYSCTYYNCYHHEYKTYTI